MWTLLFILILVPSGGAQFPRACTLPGPLKTQTCCPVWDQDGSVCGEKSGRGTCEAPRDMRSPEPSRRDFRTDWPFSFYRHICVCKGRFSGFDCGECKEGYRGPNCESWVVTVRLGLHELDAGQRRRFVERLNQAKTTVSQRYVVLSTRNTSDVNSYAFHNATVYDILTWIHYVAAKPITTHEEPNFAHMGPAFAVWHRRYLTFFESEIRLLTKDDTFFLPYWDWTRSSTCNICTDELMGRNDHNGQLLAPSPFANWKSICTSDGDDEENFHLICPETTEQLTLLNRNPGKDHRARALPRAQDVRNAMLITQYDAFPFNQYAPLSFRNTVEGFKDSEFPGKQAIGLHNLVHVYFNGTISQVPAASNDPIFMLHHAFIDKIVEDWLRASSDRVKMYPEHSRITRGHRANDTMVPFLPLVQNIDYFAHTIKFGYTYSNSAYEAKDKEFKPDITK